MSGGPRFTGRAGGGSLVLSAHSFSSQSPGAATFLPGHSVVRASDGWALSAGYVGGNNIGRVVTYLGSTGLWIEPASTNLLPTIVLSSWNITGSVPGTVTGPDGGTAYHVVDGPSTQVFNSFTDVKTAQTFSVWGQKNGGTLLQFYCSPEGVRSAFGSTTALSTSWNRFTVTGTGTTGGVSSFAGLAASFDFRANGGIDASALTHDCNLAYPQVEAGNRATSPTPNTAGVPAPRAAEYVQDLASGLSLRGSANITCTWSPDATPAQYVADGVTRLRIVGADANYCIDVDAQRQLVRAVSGGVVSQLGAVGVLPTWAPGDVFAFSVRQWGNGTPSCSVVYTPLGGSPQNISLGIGTASLPALPSFSALYWFGHPTTGQQLHGRILGYSIGKGS